MVIICVVHVGCTEVMQFVPAMKIFLLSIFVAVATFKAHVQGEVREVAATQKQVNAQSALTCLKYATSIL